MNCRLLLLLVGLLPLLACNSTSKPGPTAPAAPSAEAVRADRPAAPAAPKIALPPVPAPDPREAPIALAVRELLQSEHLNARPIDDALATKAAERFIEYLDPGKLFLLEPQVAFLRSRASRLDDELAAGKLELARLGTALLSEQRRKVAAMTASLLDKPFDLSKQEFLQTDPDKRQHAATDEELRDLWRRHLKLQVLEAVTRMQRAAQEEQEGQKETQKGKADSGKDEPAKRAEASGTGGEKEGAKKKDDKPPPATDAEREKKAREDLAETYSARFKRLATPEPLEAVETFVNAVTSVFDPHTVYLAPDEQANFDIQMSGSLEGIGAVLSERDHYIEIREVVPGGAAWRQGDLEAGDLILSVGQEQDEPVDVTDMRLSEVVKLIRGPKGTHVTLAIRKADGRETQIEIERDVVVVEASYARGALLDLGEKHAPVGYVYLPSFYGNTRHDGGRTPERNASDDVRALLQHFEKRNVGGVLLDLRGNAGGLLSHARDITGLFIDKGPVVQARASQGRVEVQEDRDGKVYFDGEVVVLVDRFSASAAEILAGALQDYRRALVVGTGPTHGKGTVQMLIDLGRVVRHPGQPLGVLKLTVQQYFLVDGESTQQRGVVPDVVLPDPASFVESGERHLDDAVAWRAVEPMPHEPWSTARWEASHLAAASQARIQGDPTFTTLAQRGTYLKQRNEQTRVPLQLQAFRARQDDNEKKLDVLDPKLEELPPSFTVESVEYRPKKLQAEEGARADTGDRIAKWRENLARDPWIAESLRLLHEMVSAR